MMLIGKQVVEKIKAVPNEARLLVVDQAADRYFADKGIAISSELSCIERITCPAAKPCTGSCGRYFPTIHCSCNLSRICAKHHDQYLAVTVWQSL